MKSRKPRMFVASSAEGLETAYNIQENLESAAEITVWDQNVFNLSEYTIDELTKKVKTFDFGTFVFSFEDLATIRGDQVKIARDNVLLELGIFIGVLGRERCFVLMPASKEKVHFASDLLGITIGKYDPVRSDKNLVASLGPSCSKIKRAITQLGNRVNLPEGITLLNNLINGTLETVCRAICNPKTPESVDLRVFLFKRIDDQLECSHFWSPNPAREIVGRLKFKIDEQSTKRLSIVKAVVEGEIIRSEIDAGDQQKLAATVRVSDTIQFIIAAPIFDHNNSVCGVVDFDSSKAVGKDLLDNEVAESAIFRLSQHLKQLLSIQG